MQNAGDPGGENVNLVKTWRKVIQSLYQVCRALEDIDKIYVPRRRMKALFYLYSSHKLGDRNQDNSHSDDGGLFAFLPEQPPQVTLTRECCEQVLPIAGMGLSFLVNFAQVSTQPSATRKDSRVNVISLPSHDDTPAVMTSSAADCTITW